MAFGLVLITRPVEEYAETAAMVAALGYEPVACPMMVVEAVDASFSDLADFQGLIFTSARGVTRFCAVCDARDLPVYTVGDATAERARVAGFGKVVSAGGDLAALEDLLFAAHLPVGTKLLHVSGADVVRAMGVPDVQIERRVVYKAVLRSSLPDAAVQSLRRGSPKAVLFYSARSAQAFVAAVTQERLAHQFMSTKALCLADSMVEFLRVLPWRGILVAHRPDRDGMEKLLTDFKADEQEMDTPMTSTSDTALTDDQNAIEPAETVIERFGGIRPMATKMSVPVTTVQGWKKRNVIPGNRREDVMRAARQNNIEISDVLNKPAANDTDFSAVMAATKAADANHATMTRVSDSGLDQEALMGRIKQAESRAVKKSAAITVTVVSAVAIAAAILLGPGMRGSFEKAAPTDGTEVQALRDDVERIESNVNEVKEEQFSLKSLIPADLNQKMDEMTQQAVALKDNVAQLSTQIGAMTQAAQGITNDVMGPHAGDITQRMSALQTHVQSVTGTSIDLGGLMGRLAQFKQMAGGEQMLDESTNQLMQLIAGMNGDMSQLEPQLQAAQAQNNTELGQVLQGVSPTDLKAASMLLGLTQFRTSLRRNAPFEEDLAMMQSMVGKDDPALQEAIARLAPQAKKGVLSSQGLSDQLKGLTGDIVVSSIKGEDVSIREKAMARMNDVFQVQKNGELVTGTDTQATIARAQKMLDDGKIDDAVVELQSLQGPARETAQPVIDEAMMTSLAQQVSTMMTGKVAAQLPTGGTGTLPDANGILKTLSGMSPEAIGSSLGSTVKSAGGGHAPYTAGGYGLESVMQTMESVGAPTGGGAGQPIHMPTP